MHKCSKLPAPLFLPAFTIKVPLPAEIPEVQKLLFQESCPSPRVVGVGVGLLVLWVLGHRGLGPPGAESKPLTQQAEEKHHRNRDTRKPPMAAFQEAIEATAKQQDEKSKAMLDQSHVEMMEVMKQAIKAQG